MAPQMEKEIKVLYFHKMDEGLDYFSAKDEPTPTSGDYDDVQRE